MLDEGINLAKGSKGNKKGGLKGKSIFGKLALEGVDLDLISSSTSFGENPNYAYSCDTIRVGLHCRIWGKGSMFFVLMGSGRYHLRSEKLEALTHFYLGHFGGQLFEMGYLWFNK
jgi:hypothetical protein